MKRLGTRLRAAWRWYVEAVKPHAHDYGDTGECECGKLAGDW